MKKVALGVLFLLACALSFSACAGDEDSIEVQASSYTGMSVFAADDSLTINLVRPYAFGDSDSAKEQLKNNSLEKLFVEVEGILRNRKIEKSWSWLPIDLPTVSIKIKMNGKEISLESSHPYLGDKQILERIKYLENPKKDSCTPCKKSQSDAPQSGKGKEEAKPREPSKWDLAEAEEMRNGKQAFDEIYAAIRLYVNTETLPQVSK